MQKTRQYKWNCQHCGGYGVFFLVVNESISEVIERVAKLHKLSAPKCKFDPMKKPKSSDQRRIQIKCLETS